MAIADATMQYLVQTIQCKTLFITHYPLVASKLQTRFPDDIENLHMGYHADSQIDSTRSITFLYHLTAGMATESFGIECGRLAKIPESILNVASERSSRLQGEVQKRVRRNRLRRAVYLIQQCLDKSGIVEEGTLEDLGVTCDFIKNMKNI